MKRVCFLAAFGVGVMVALPPQATPQADTHPTVERYAIYLDNSMYGEWDYMTDSLDPSAIHTMYGHEFAWFRYSTKQYVVNDPRVLSDLRRAVEPQNVVDRVKDQLNAQKRQLSMVSLFATLQLKMADALPMMREGRQQIIDKAQARVSEQQHVVDDLQRKVDAEANASYAESRARIIDILESAFRTGVAHPLR